MKTLHITVVDKIATYRQRDGVIVCGNSDYVIEFAFDSEWDARSTKTARFITGSKYTDVVFVGTSVVVPVIKGADSVSVGVFAGNLQTTTPAVIMCQKSILCDDGLPDDPTTDVYAQIIELLEKSGGVDQGVIDDLTARINTVDETVSDLVDVFEIKSKTWDAVGVGFENFLGEYADKMEEVSDIREDINRISSEIVDIPNNDLLLKRVADKVPYMKVAEQPTFVNSIAEMTDTSKVYVLNSDGMIYAYMSHTTITPGGTFPNFTNRVPISTEADEVTIYNGGLGYKDGYRVRSGGEEGATERGSCTGFIPLKAGDTVRLSGYNAMYDDAANAINVFNASKENIGQAASNVSTHGYGIFETQYKDYGWASITENPNGVYVWVVPPHSDIAFMRVGGYTMADGSKMIVTVNEEITYTTVEGGTTTTYSWESTCISYNQPADYENRVIALEKELEVLLNGSF